MVDGVSTTPPETDNYVWYREDRVLGAMQEALNAAVEMHGNKAKSVAWDVKGRFREALRA